MPRPPLTKRQKDILEFFRDFTARHGISPTLEEIAQHFGVNKVTVYGHVSELRRKGVLDKPVPGVSRGLRLVEEHDSRRGRVPVVGTIAAGRPLDVVVDSEEFDLNDLLPPDREVYALRVRGDSMIDDGIREGDLVLVERRSNARNGETVVAVLPDEEATLKRFYRETNRIRLQPANPTMDPLFVTDVEIRGVVLGVVRRL